MVGLVALEFFASGLGWLILWLWLGGDFWVGCCISSFWGWCFEGVCVVVTGFGCCVLVGFAGVVLWTGCGGVCLAFGFCSVCVYW